MKIFEKSQIPTPCPASPPSPPAGITLIGALEERRQLEKALYFKAVGISKQACYRCFLRDRVKNVNLSDGSSRLPGKENGYCGDFVVSPLNGRLNALF